MTDPRTDTVLRDIVCLAVPTCGHECDRCALTELTSRLDSARQGFAWLADLHASRCRATSGCDECPDFGPCPLDRRECPRERVHGADWQRAAVACRTINNEEMR